MCEVQDWIVQAARHHLASGSHPLRAEGRHHRRRAPAPQTGRHRRGRQKGRHRGARRGPAGRARTRGQVAVARDACTKAAAAALPLSRSRRRPLQAPPLIEVAWPPAGTGAARRAPRSCFVPRPRSAQRGTITVKNSPGRNLHRLMNSMLFIRLIFQNLAVGQTMKEAVNGEHRGWVRRRGLKRSPER